MVKKEDILIKSKLWKAGTNTLVMGIPAKDVKYFGFKAGDILLIQVIKRYKKKVEKNGFKRNRS